MKKRRLEKRIIEELEKTANISVACAAVGLSRQSFYRWVRGDAKFRLKTEDAISIGNDSIDDLAEGKLIGLIKDGNITAIKYRLDNSKYKRKNKKPKEDRIEEIKVTIVKASDEIRELKRLERLNDQS